MTTDAESMTEPTNPPETTVPAPGKAPARRPERTPEYASAPGSASHHISLEGLNAYYNDVHAVKDIDLTFEPDRVTAIIGPSGCGKSTMVRCVNRMHEEIPGARSDGRVRLTGAARGEMSDRVKSALVGAGLWEEVSGRLNKPGASLSGGQQQRLCIAR